MSKAKRKKKPTRVIGIKTTSARFPHHNVWTPDDAATIQARMVEFYGTEMGKTAAAAPLRAINPDFEYESDLTPDDLALTLQELWQRSTITWADPSFAKMVQAAALSLPTSTIRQEDFLGPEGVLFFSEPIFATEGAGGLQGWDVSVPLRGLLWMTSDGRFIIYVLTDGDPTLVHETARDYYVSPFTHTLAMLNGGFDHEYQGDTWFTSLLVAATAVSKSPLTVNEDVLPGARTGKIARSRGIVDRPVRRSSLRHREYGDLELDAARGARGVHSPQRFHYVRGHWRQQWYPTVQEHRVRWIDGFSKGNIDLGAVSGTKVLIGAGDRVLQAA